MKPSEIIQEAITNPNLYKGVTSLNSNTHTIYQEYMCNVVRRIVDVDDSLRKETVCLIDKAIGKYVTLYSYLLAKEAITECTSDEEVRVEQFKFWNQFIKELQEQGL